MGFSTMTPVQAKAIPPLLTAKMCWAPQELVREDFGILDTSVELLHRMKFKPRNGGFYLHMF